MFLDKKIPLFKAVHVFTQDEISYTLNPYK